MNHTLTHLFATRPAQMLAFSGALTNQSVYLTGPGALAGDGVPMPRRGTATRLAIWDGTTLHIDSSEVAFEAGDRLSIYCQSTGTDFTVRLRLNGSSSLLQLAGVPYNRSVYATLECVPVRD